MELSLVHNWHCSESLKVRDFISKNNLGPHVSLVEVEDDSEKVPCLMINGNKLFESENIIRWMENHLLTYYAA